MLFRSLFVAMPYEKAIASLVLEPLALEHTLFAAEDVLTRRFAVGHNLGEDGTLSVARMWRGPRYRNPGAGMTSSVADQLRWARFHLGDGRAAAGVYSADEHASLEAVTYYWHFVDIVWIFLFLVIFVIK